MLNRICSALVVLLAAISNASAQQVEWVGGGVMTNPQNCSPVLTAPTGRSFTVRYHHPDLGDNGPNARLSLFFHSNVADHFNTSSSGGGPFRDTFTKVTGQTIGRGTAATKVRMKMRRFTPAPEDVDAFTPEIRFMGTMKGYRALPGFEDCIVDFEIVVFR